MTNFRLRYEKRGAHIHARLFSATHPNLTHASNGDLCFREDEWESFLRCFTDRGTDTIQVIKD